MIYVYEKSATPIQLNANGLSRVDAESAIVLEEINGDFSADLSVPIGASGAEFCTVGAILKIPCHRALQYFRIWTADQDTERIKIKAWHISYDLSAAIIMNSYWDAKTGAEAIAGILAASDTESRFSGTSDIASVNNMRSVRSSVLASIIDKKQDNCFLNRWGGEAERDNFTFNVKASLGSDSGFRIAYKKNLTGFKLTEDASQLATRIIPSALSDTDAVVLLPEVYIDSSHINDYAIPYVRTVHFSDIKLGEEVDGVIPYPDTTEMYAEMRNRVGSMFAAGCDLPIVAAEIDFLMLGDTEEYKQYKNLEAVHLGDTVTGAYRGTTITRRVRAITYDALQKRVTKVTLGDAKRNTVGDAIYAHDVDLSALKTSMNTTLKQTDKYYGCGIDHTNGFSCTAEDGHYSKFNADVMGFFDALGNQVGGMAYINSVLASIASILTNDATDPAFWATIGEIQDGANQRQGIMGYARDYSTSNPIYSITSGQASECQYFSLKFGPTEIYCELYPTNHANDFMRFYLNGHLRMALVGNGGFFVYDQNDIARLNLNSLGNCTIKNGAGKSVFESNDSLTAIRLSGSSDNAIKMTSAGAFNLVINGVDHPISYT